MADQIGKATPGKKLEFTQAENGDFVCEHGTAADVHCCQCRRSGYFPPEDCDCYANWPDDEPVDDDVCHHGVSFSEACEDCETDGKV